MNNIKVEFHCHTSNSFDCDVTLENRLTSYGDLGFTHLSITDHDAVLTQKDWRIINQHRGDLKIIPAIEVSTHVGHVILLNCRIKPFFNSLFFLVVWSKLFGCDIYVPHPFRRGTGILVKYVEEGISTAYVYWFFKHVKYLEVWNPRDRTTHKVIVDKRIFDVLSCGMLWTSASDSHFMDDIYINGCNLSGLDISEKHVQNFFQNKIEAGDVELSFNLRSFLRYVKSSLRYALNYFKS